MCRLQLSFHTCNVLRWRPTLFAHSIYMRGWRDGGTEIRITPKQCHNPPAGSNVMAGVPVALNFQDANAWGSSARAAVRGHCC